MLQGFLVGRIGKDAELKKTNSGIDVSNFSVAVVIGYGEREKTIWIDCTMWASQAKALNQYLTKGKQVALTGQLDVRAWLSDKDREAKANIQMSVSEVTFCGSPQNSSSEPQK
jgi:single-strand DNA-binding protein